MLLPESHQKRSQEKDKRISPQKRPKNDSPFREKSNFQSKEGSDKSPVVDPIDDKNNNTKEFKNSKENDSQIGTFKLTMKNSSPEKDQSKLSYINSVKSLIKQLPEIKLERRPKQVIPQIIDLKKLIATDAHILNYGSFLVGKMLACNLKISNISEEDISIDLSFDQSQYLSSSGLPIHKLTSVEQMGSKAINSEKKYSCWFFEDSDSKDLVKSMNISIEKECTSEILVVFKSPKISKAERLYSIINIIKSAKNESLIQKSMKIVLHANLETPMLSCCKELNTLDGRLQLIPLVVKKDIGVNRFRIPFKNQGNFELNIEFSIEPIPHIPGLVGVEYIVLPAKCTIAPKQLGIMNLAVKCIRIGETTKKDQKLLVVRLNETQVLYTYLLETAVL